MQDQKRALILGTTSFGKGSVQAIENLRDGYALKLTIARYYTPSGRSIQAKGVEPDIEVVHKILDDADEEKRQMLTERDLANHLDAEPKGKSQRGKQPQSPTQKDQSVQPPSRLSPLNAEEMMKDSQVRRALDILISYDIFQKLSNG